MIQSVHNRASGEQGFPRYRYAQAGLLMRWRSAVVSDSDGMTEAENDYSHILDPNLRRRLVLSEIDKVLSYVLQ